MCLCDDVNDGCLVSLVYSVGPIETRRSMATHVQIPNPQLLSD